MGDENRGATAPLGIAVDPTAAPAPARAATQVSASAVPSTLESPHEDEAVKPAPAGPRKVEPKLAQTIDDIDGAHLNDEAMAEIARRAAAADDAPSDRHPIGPPTLVSPGGIGAPVPYPPAPPQNPKPYVDGSDPHGHASFGSPVLHGGGMHAAQAARRPMSGLLIVLILVGSILLLGGVALVGVTVLAVGARRAAETRQEQAPHVTAPPIIETVAQPPPPPPPPPAPTIIATTPPLGATRSPPARTSPATSGHRPAPKPAPQ